MDSFPFIISTLIASLFTCSFLHRIASFFVCRFVGDSNFLLEDSRFGAIGTDLQGGIEL